jgi:endoglycosylceramidase
VGAAPAGAAAPALDRFEATRGESPATVDRGGRQILLRGVNVNQLGDYYRANPGLDPTVPLREADFDQIASFGFDSVRLLVHWSLLEPSPGAFDQAYVARIRQAVRWARERGIYVVLDMHQDAWGKFVATPPEEQCAPGFSRDVGWDGAPQWATFTDGLPTCRAGGVREITPAVAQAWQSFWIDRAGIQTHLVETWAKLARAFAADPTVAGYDLINEPNPGFTPSATAPTLLSQFYTRTTDAIRAAERSAPGGFSHTIFFEPLVVWSATAVDAIPPPTFTADTNIVFAPHVYAGSLTVTPFVTSHEGHDFAAQGAASYGTTYWSGEWGWFGDAASERGLIAGYAKEEDSRLVGGAWWQWKQACGDPHNIGEPGGRPGSTTGNINRFACPEQRSLGTPATTRRILARAYARAAPGRLTALASDPDTGALRVAGRDDNRSGSCELVIWLPGDFGRPELSARGVSNLRVHGFAGGWIATGCAHGAYEVRRVRVAGALGSQRGCVAHSAPIGPRNIGRVRLGDTRARQVHRIRFGPTRATSYSYRWCVKRSKRRVTAVFSKRGRSGRALLVGTTATRHRMRGVGPGARGRTLRRRFPRARRLTRTIFAAGPHSRRLFGVRRGRVRFVAVADRRLLRKPTTLRRYLRRGGL